MSPNHNSTRTSSLKFGSNFNRAGSLRTNSNGNVVTSHHRKASNTSLQSLQYDSINKGSSVRYQPNKSSKGYHPNSAPSTPRGLSSRQNQDYSRHSNSNHTSPSPRRSNHVSHQQQQHHPNTHRRSHSNPGSNMLDHMINKEQQHYSNYRNNLNDVRHHDNRNDVMKNEQGSHNRNPSDMRSRNNMMPPRKDVLPHNDLDYNSYHGNTQQLYDREQHFRDNNGRPSKFLQESRSLPPQSNFSHPSHPSNSYDARNNYSQQKTSIDPAASSSNFSPADNHYPNPRMLQHHPHQHQQQHLQHQHYIDTSDHRNTPGDTRRLASQPIVVGSPQKQPKNPYNRNPHVNNSLPSDNRSRDVYMNNKPSGSTQLDTVKRDRGGLSPRQQQQHHQQLQHHQQQHQPGRFLDHLLLFEIYLRFIYFLVSFYNSWYNSIHSSWDSS